MLVQIKHKTAMFKILSEILRDSYLAAVLGFKGGTACFFFHGLPRFSTDLDFDVADDTKFEETCVIIHQKIEKILVQLGYDINEDRLKKNTVFFLVSYEKNAQLLKIEISRRGYPNSYEIKEFYGLAVRTMVKADMFAHKLVAATDRRKMAPRDFFDVLYFFQKGWPVNEEIVRLRTGKSLKEYLGVLRGFIQSELSERNVLYGIGDLVDSKQKAWVKANLKKELIRHADFTIDSL